MIKSNFLHILESGKFYAEPGYFTERSDVPSYLCFYTIRGEGILKYQEKTYNLSANSLFFIDCQLAQRYEIKQNCNLWEFDWLHFYGVGAENYFNLFFNDKNPVINDLQQADIPLLIENLIFTTDISSTNQTELTTHLQLHELLTLLLKDKENTGFSNIQSTNSDMEKVKQYIDYYFTAEITLSSLAMLVAINKYQLCKDFKKHYSITPIDYLIKVRVNQSKKLLIETKLSISEVAKEVGIINTTHFINLFKKKNNLTPLQYRKIWG